MTPAEVEKEALRCIESGECRGLYFADCGKTVAAAFREAVRERDTLKAECLRLTEEVERLDTGQAKTGRKPC